jgi:hypothetical protein
MRSVLEEFRAASLLGGACPPIRSPLGSVNLKLRLHGASPGRVTMTQTELRNEQECFAGGVNA